MEKICFARNQYLELLTKRIGSLKEGYRQNLAIVGDELSGKTTILFSFLKQFSDTRTIILYLEIRPESLITFTKRFTGTLLFNFLAASGNTPQEDLDSLLRDSEKYIPKTVEKIKGILSAVEKRKRNTIFPEILALCDSIHQETGKFCVVMFDEFHNLESFGIKDLYKDWAKLLILQKTTLYIIVSSKKFKAHAILSKDLSLLFGNFEIVTVEPFTVKASEEYLQLKFKNSPINPGWLNFIIHFTGGIPFYLDIIAQSLIKTNTDNLAHVIDDLMFEPSGILNQRFSTFLKQYLDSSCSRDYMAILYNVASGHTRIKDIAHLTHKSLAELTTRITHLLETDCLTKSGDFLTINDRVFGFWLKFVYQEKLQSLTFDAINQKAQFRGKIELMIKDFISATQKPVCERMKELLHLFEDETIQLEEKKKLRLDRFREIKTLNFNGKSLKDGLLGRSNDSLWILGYKKNLITEEDVTDFSKECKKYRHKLQRKIIVTANEIDANARLRALEEKIWTWDINNINGILDLYSKPRIIA